jgi:hypothetical protein
MEIVALTRSGMVCRLCSGVIKMLESFDFRGHFCLVFGLLGMSMYDFLRCVALSAGSALACVRQVAGVQGSWQLTDWPAASAG